MNRQVEIRWAVFLFITLVFTFGLLSGFRSGDSLDIQIYDTYYVISNGHMFLLISLTLLIAYLITLVLRRLAHLNKFINITTIMVAGLLGVGCFVLSLLLLTKLDQGKPINSAGFVVFFLGLGLLFIMRMKEIYKLK